jgi:hypothetical protein
VAGPPGTKILPFFVSTHVLKAKYKSIIAQSRKVAKKSESSSLMFFKFKIPKQLILFARFAALRETPCL